ncbi:hypothetical protein BKA69DRAFT_1168761 [Paraphysoderma sedebokerense]|nr:hypothetical protein BKA69DRAFT_1168761 [Paraphysoderma sedebokerense]
MSIPQSSSNRNSVKRKGIRYNVGDHVFLRAEQKGEPYYIGRIVGFVHPDQVRLVWFYRPHDILSRRKSYDPHLLVASMHSDVNSVKALIGKCTIKHTSKISNLSEYKTLDSCFYYNQLFDRFTKRVYDVIPSKDVLNRPPEVTATLRQFQFVLIEEGKATQLTSSMEICRACKQWVSTDEKVTCVQCKKIYHGHCVELEGKINRGYAWLCHYCSNPGSSESIGSPTLSSIPSSPPKSSLSLSSPSVRDFSENSTFNEKSAFPFCYFGIHCTNEEILEVDPAHPIYPRSCSRVQSKYQAVLPEVGSKPFLASYSTSELDDMAESGQNISADYLTPLIAPSKGGRKKKGPKSRFPGGSGTLSRTESNSSIASSSGDHISDNVTALLTQYSLIRGSDPPYFDHTMISGSELNRYHLLLQSLSSTPFPSYSATFLDRALLELTVSKYDVDKAFNVLKRLSREDYLNGTSPNDSVEENRTLLQKTWSKARGETEWSDEDKENFLKGTERFGRDVWQIKSQFLPLKPMKEVVLYFYRSKKSKEYRDHYDKYLKAYNISKRPKAAAATTSSSTNGHSDSLLPQQEQSKEDLQIAQDIVPSTPTITLLTSTEIQPKQTTPETVEAEETTETLPIHSQLESLQLPTESQARRLSSSSLSSVESVSSLSSISSPLSSPSDTFSSSFSEISSSDLSSPASSGSGSDSDDSLPINPYLFASSSSYLPFYKPPSSDPKSCSNCATHVSSKWIKTNRVRTETVKGQKMNKRDVVCAECGDYWLKYGVMKYISEAIVRRNKDRARDRKKRKRFGDGRSDESSFDDDDFEEEFYNDLEATSDKRKRGRPKKSARSSPAYIPPPPPPLCAMCGEETYASKTDSPLKDDNQSKGLQKCIDCGMSVHGACSSVIQSAEDDSSVLSKSMWRCSACTNNLQPTISVSYKCILCPPNQPLSPPMPLVRTVGHNWVHLICGLWMPEIRFRESEKNLEMAEGADVIGKEKWSQTCSICNTPGGACVSCGDTSCSSVFHISCALREKYYFGLLEESILVPVTTSTSSQSSLHSNSSLPSNSLISNTPTSSAQKLRTELASVPTIWCREHVLNQDGKTNSEDTTLVDSGAIEAKKYSSKTGKKRGTNSKTGSATVSPLVKSEDPSSNASKRNKPSKQLSRSNSLDKILQPDTTSSAKSSSNSTPNMSALERRGSFGPLSATVPANISFEIIQSALDFAKKYKFIPKGRYSSSSQLDPESYGFQLAKHKSTTRSKFAKNESSKKKTTDKKLVFVNNKFIEEDDTVKNEFNIDDMTRLNIEQEPKCWRCGNDASPFWFDCKQIVKGEPVEQQHGNGNGITHGETDNMVFSHGSKGIASTETGILPIQNGVATDVGSAVERLKESKAQSHNSSETGKEVVCFRCHSVGLLENDGINQTV